MESSLIRGTPVIYFNAFYTFYFAYFRIICFIYGTWALINGLTLYPRPSRSYQRVDVIFAMQIIYINRVGDGGGGFRFD